ncbi:MAG TPA: hypothetical protein VGL97_18910, partial [Bryobacteraceae bacterium]
GCVSAGTAVDPNAVAGFERGHTTYADVVGRLGTPNTDALAADGTRIVVYSYTQARARPESFIPIVGPLVGGTDATTTGYEFRFDQNGIMTGIGKTYGRASASVWRGTYAGTTTPSGAPEPASIAPPSAQQPVTPLPPPALQRSCTEAEAAQKRIAIENGYTMIPNCR